MYYIHFKDRSFWFKTKNKTEAYVSAREVKGTVSTLKDNVYTKIKSYEVEEKLAF